MPPRHLPAPAAILCRRRQSSVGRIPERRPQDGPLSGLPWASVAPTTRALTPQSLAPKAQPHISPPISRGPDQTRKSNLPALRRYQSRSPLSCFSPARWAPGPRPRPRPSHQSHFPKTRRFFPNLSTSPAIPAGLRHWAAQSRDPSLAQALLGGPQIQRLRNREGGAFLELTSLGSGGW